MAAGSLDEQLARLAATVPAFRPLIEAGPAEQQARGYFHTLREIVQQPSTWRATASAMPQHAAAIRRSLENAHVHDRQGAIVFTGSGSSVYVGDSSVGGLQRAFGVPVSAVAAGDILVGIDSALPPAVPLLLVSIARSGNSPESCGAVDLVLEKRPDARHLVITCCAEGRLATRYTDEPRVQTILLDEATCDRSLVMTSSFTNLAIAARGLAQLDALPTFARLVDRMSALAQEILIGHTGRLATIGGGSFGSAIFLGSGDGFGVARESALKMLEMTAGRVRTFAETFLGLRHGPMSAVHADTLLVCYLSCDPMVRAYEQDLIGELNAKGIGARRIVVGQQVPPELGGRDGTIVDCRGLCALGSDHAPLVQLIVGQLLAFFQCLHLGLRPDEPSAAHVITRVVSPFTIHRS